MINREALKQRLIREEALRLFPYVDTVGKISIGVGRNLTDKGISPAIAMQMLDEDIDDVLQGLAVRGRPWFTGLDQVRQQVVADMVFNLGLTGFFGFTRMVRHIANGEFVEAAREGRRSKWFRQVGHRGEVLMREMETGCE